MKLKERLFILTVLGFGLLVAFFNIIEMLSRLKLGY
ncbi:hypothetical protein LCGC14_1714200 [marine sediment metagenome]|uniref:Uncharacterized protein n=1 Tax=marine sediment metagenome TaxID=412755 RepID=A0A0F9JUV9_9ZZZZ